MGRELEPAATPQPDAPGHRRPPAPLVAALIGMLVVAPVSVSAAATPTVVASPTAVAAGAVVNVNGESFPANSAGQLFFDAVSAHMPRFRTNKRGSFSASFTVPADSTIGAHVLTAQATPRKGAAPSVSVSTSLQVTASWLTPTLAPPPEPQPSATVEPGRTEPPSAPPQATSEPAGTLLPLPSGPITPPLIDPQPSFPVRAAFYYPWFPEAWNQGGLNPFTKYHPSLGSYDSSAVSVIGLHIGAMQYGKIGLGIASWWGQGTRSDGRLPTILAATAGSSFRWSVYHEAEGQGDPSVSELAADLRYLRDRFGSDPSYYRVNGRFVVFVYADSADGCGMVDRWAQANAGINAYIVLKVFGGYRSCASQPSGWHQYAPAVASDSQSGYSYSISPGFALASEATPRLERDLARWKQNVRDMVASAAPFQLVTTFNEWGEGTSVESANEWATPSGYGAYLDALHSDGGGTALTPTPAPDPTPPPTPPPSSADDISVLAAGDIAGCSSPGDDATANLLAALPGTIITAGDNAYDSGTAAEFQNCFDPTWGRFKVEPGS